ncbi:flavin reductase family protein [Paracidobacterium acidisoli]|uniref:Flavin reductase family protein n=1 Tax=Paracidobacterium acidisoli TaxID=2303751 RepID=A0A372IUT5_9BACT|nr:flavin reductase family protein [Paracidobacterium acidisoli]MBT9330014.1 flavin reductase family protein [Paracidobacterium acidisoli]
MRTFIPGEHAPGDIYKLMIGMIVPRPIAFVSSVDVQGVRNLAPFSYFTGCSTNPPVVCFCAAVRTGARPHKDTLENIRATGEFVVNIVSEEFTEKMNATSAEVAPEVDEFALAGLTPLASDLVKPARVAESRIHMECRLREVVVVSELPGGGSLVLGDVLRFHIAEEVLLDSYKIDPEKLKAVGRMGGPTFVRTHDRFDMKRP